MCLVLLLMMAIGFVADEACAKWWIFGQSEQEVATRYLYLNGIAYDELGDKVTVYRETLEQGKVVFKGRGQAGKSRVGAVQISLDGGVSWQKAALAADGSFEFGFKPQMGETYQVSVKILDTAGKSNDVDATRKELVMSDLNISAVVREALDQLIAAYHSEDARSFMTLVDEDFAGDATVLDRGVRKDFTLFDNLDLRYTLNNVTSGSQGKIFTSISFRRQVTSTRSGQTFQDRGVTEFIFLLNGDRALVSAMKNPLIFGLSEAAEVATGTVNSGENNEVLIIDESGAMRLGPVGADSDTLDNASDVLAPTNLRVTDSFPHHSYSFAFDFPINSMENDLSIIYDIVLEESLAPGGPWTEVFREHFWDPRFVNITTTHIAQSEAFLFYRAKVESQSTGEQSLPTNVVMVDNR
jgi:hypothetical protein